MSARARRLRCRVCGQSVHHAAARLVIERAATCTCQACYEAAEGRQGKGWEILPTRHGPRFHREIGLGLALDVEEGGGGSFVASAVRDRQLVAVRVGLPSAAAAAEAIEIAAKVMRMPLPHEGAVHG